MLLLRNCNFVTVINTVMSQIDNPLCTASRLLLLAFTDNAAINIFACKLCPYFGGRGMINDQEYDC